MLDSCVMITFLKIFFGIILLLLAILFVSCTPVAAVFFGEAGFIVQLIVSIALIAGAISLFISAGR